MKAAIRAGVRPRDIIQRFKVTGSTVAYHRKQIAEADAVAQEKAQETLETLDEMCGLPTKPDGIKSFHALQYEESAEDQLRRLRSHAKSLEIEVERWKLKSQARDELISIYALREHNLL